MNDSRNLLPAAKPVRISQGEGRFRPGQATKTYVHNFTESPDGSRVLYRFYVDAPDGTQDACMMTCRTDGSGHMKLFDIPSKWRETWHGSESMIWLDDDRIYYNGIMFSTVEMRILWRLTDPANPAGIVSGWTFPAKGDLAVNIRTGADAGYYLIDPYSRSIPVLRPLITRETMLPFLGGDPAAYQFTYIFMSPGGTRLFFDILTGCENGFTSNADGSDIFALGTTQNRTVPWNGHTIWYDEDRLIHPSGRTEPGFRDGYTRMCDYRGRGSRIVAGRSNHITVSPDRKWIAADDCSGEMRLYSFGSKEAVASLMAPELMAAPGEVRHAHPSFSRDSRRVYFLAIEEGSIGVYYSDVSRWTAK